MNETENKTVEPTERTTLRRVAFRGCFDRDKINAILDEGIVCHVSFVMDGKPASIPMAYARIGDRLYLHGSTANQMMRAIRDTSEACITVTLLDGLVLARSAFHHSVNFRSVVLYGSAEEITDREEKMAALEATVNHVVPGRWEDTRRPNEEEFLRTLILAVPIEEVSAKLRDGPPLDEQHDMEFDTWAGVIPLRQEPLPPETAPDLRVDRKPPAYAVDYKRPPA